MSIGKDIVEKLIGYEGNTLRRDLLRIAFCPYKASMFDCMESVYLAAKEFKMVHADIIPLDYQTLPDGEWHNESKQFPYPCEPFETLLTGYYDIIVIHYPYDGCNNLTKLRPDCFAESLKRYGKVCYIPYHGNIGGEEWKRFYTMPGAVNSDYIVLGSDLDVKVFKNVNPMYSGTIIQVADSPKTEAQLLHKDDHIPFDWSHLYRPITVIIGTLWTFTHDPIGRINKHTKIILQEAEAGHGIVYRPHPLVRNAIAVMRPEALQKYDEFIEKIRELGVEIDSGPNLHRTIAIAEKIYIDPSSVIKSIEKHREFEVIS